MNRVNLLLGRVFAITAPLVGLQMAATGLVQFSRSGLDPFWFWLNWIFLIAPYLWLSVSTWVKGFSRAPYCVIVFATLFSFATWPLQLATSSLEAGEQPWIWWAVGVAGVAAMGGFSILPALFFILTIPTLWLCLQTFASGAVLDPVSSIRDSVLTFLASSVLASFVGVLRYEASLVDEANYQAGLSEIELTRVNASVKERNQIDALIHDSVLTALIVASGSKSQNQEQEAASLASAAADRLASILEDGDHSKQVSMTSFFAALEESILQKSNKVSIHSGTTNNFPIPSDIAEGLTEATLQAVGNSITHAGKNAAIVVFLKGKAKGLKIVISDDGRGFRPSRVPQNRLGLKLSVISRVQNLGGRVRIDSRINRGTNIVIEWPSK